MIKLHHNIDEVIAKLRRIPAILDRTGLRILGNAAAEVVRDMSKPALPVRYPINWDSPKQQTAYFASGGFGRGIPSRGTGASEQAWQTQAIANGHLISNIGHKAVFLYGHPSGVGSGSKVTATGQSHIHAGRRPVFRRVVDAVVARLPEKILQALRIEIGK
jgi:hypothetical protein